MFKAHVERRVEERSGEGSGARPLFAKYLIKPDYTRRHTDAYGILCAMACVVICNQQWQSLGDECALKSSSFAWLSTSPLLLIPLNPPKAILIVSFPPSGVVCSALVNAADW